MKTSKIRLMELAGLREVDDIAGTYGKLNYGDFEFIKVTQQVWDKLTDIEQANAVLSAIDDTDEAEGYIGAAWDELPSQATANMKIAIKKGTSINEAISRNAVIKLEIPVNVGELADLFVHNRDRYDDGEGGLKPDIMLDPKLFSEWKRAVEKYLSTWLMEENPQTGEAGQWAAVGIENGAFDPYIYDDPSDPYGKNS